MAPTSHPAPGWFDSGGSGQAATGIGQAGSGSPYTGLVVYFRVNDIDDAVARAVAPGGTRAIGPGETPVSRIAAFATRRQSRRAAQPLTGGNTRTR